MARLSCTAVLALLLGLPLAAIAMQALATPAADASAPVSPATAPDLVDPLDLAPDLRPPGVAERRQLDTARERAREEEREGTASTDSLPLLRAALAASEASYGPEHPATAYFLSALADTLYSLASESEALPSHRRALEIYRARLGEAHPRTRGSQSLLANRLVGQRRYDEAEPLLRRLLVVEEAALGADDFESAVSLGMLADILRGTGRMDEATAALARAYAITVKAVGADHLMAVSAHEAWVGAIAEAGDAAQAEALYRRHLGEREASLGPDDMMVARSAMALARLLDDERREDEAEALFQRVLRIYREARGENAREAVGVRFRLARLLERQGRYPEAEAAFRQVLAADEANHVSGSPVIAGSLGALAGVLEAQGRPVEAEPLRRRALEIQAANYGADDTRTLAAVGELAGNLHAQARHAEGEVLARRILAARERTLGSGHADTAWAREAVAIALEQAGRHAEAEPLYLEALSTMERVQGADSADALQLAEDLADMYQDWGRLARSEALFRRVYEGRRQRLGEDHPQVGESMARLADVLDAQGRHAEAEPLYRQSLAIREARLGPDHVDTAAAVHDLAGVLNALGRYPEAIQLDRRALAIRQARLGGDDPDTIASLSNLAGDLTESRLAMEEGGALYRRALEASERRHGADAPATALYLGNLGWYLNLAGRPAEAEPLLRRSLAIRERQWGADSLDVAYSLKNLGVSLELQQRPADAEALYRRALAIRQEGLGEDHPQVAEVLGQLAGALRKQGRMAEAEREAGRAVAIARAQRARESARADALASARAFGDAVDPMQQAYRDYLPIAWEAARRGNAEAVRLRDAAFTAAQDLDVSGAARALAQAAARIADGGCAAGTAADDCLATQARRQQDLATQLRELDRVLLAATGEGDAAATATARTQAAATAAELRATDAHLRSRFPQYASLVSPRALEPVQLQARLHAGEALLLLVPAGADVFAFGVGAGGVAWHRFEDGADAVAARVALLRCQVDNATCGTGGAGGTRGVASVFGASVAQGGRPFDRSAAFALYRDLVAPVEPALAGAQRLYVVATGPIASLPLGVLVTTAPAAGEDDADPAVLARTAWLADRYALVTLPAVSSLRALGQAAAATAAQPFVGFGDPLLAGGAAAARSASTGNASAPRYFRSADARGVSLADPASLRRLASLPGTRVELEAMVRELDVSADRLSVGAAATEAAVKADPRLREARVVAFATHGLLPREIDGLEQPGLVFTPPQVASDADDGVLAASEAAMLQLRAEWLILSACNTAAADGRGAADSLSGLARAFLYAGAQALLVSHWRVRDDVTAALTVQTLREWRGGDASRAGALQQAMHSVRTGVTPAGEPVPGWKPDWAHPAAWAPFVVVSAGDR
ncbi:MAG: CHAT domain-containing protein [Pseudoxanthomonas sp.]|nr:CHAT domain-containing protein [Pseudoxanthomonas sp.]